MLPRRPAPLPRASSGLKWLGFFYVLLIVYGSLFPLTGWQAPPSWSNPIMSPWPAHDSRADILVNLLAYLPLGLLLSLIWRRAGKTTGLLFAVAAGFALSFCMEFLQEALPSRVSSAQDVVNNTLGTVAGALLALGLSPGSFTGRRLLAWRESRFAPGTLPNLALVVLLLWAATELAPFAPSLDISTLKAGLRPLANTLRHPSLFNLPKALMDGCAIFGIGVLARIVTREPVLPLLIPFVMGVTLLKIMIVGQTLSLEFFCAALAALAILSLLTWQNLRGMAWLGIAAIALAKIIDELRPGSTPGFYAFNWIPFAAQVGSLAGIDDLLGTLWPALGLAVLARMITGWRLRPWTTLAGGALLFGVWFGLEWHQRSLPGRVPDITDPLIGLLAWWAGWAVRERPAAAHAVAPPPPATAPPMFSRRWMLLALAAVAGSIALAGWREGSRRIMDTDERGRNRLPEPKDLPAPDLPGFRTAHPRLPHPSAADIQVLQHANPGWLGALARLAGGGRGQLTAAITQAYIAPGSIDLDLLQRRLLALKYSYRGNDQAKPVALAYDWLYEQWNEAQRAALREKLAEGVDFLINVIRKERLSPYNVFLYNSPLQALVAANLALYRDSARGDVAMRFTYDLWINRVLPVWRQIMGKQGGWHEGGEYVGIGIGQAVYQLPAMWLAATGEDLFARQPGIRGFLDFALYRTRPDGTQMRWGDGAFFKRMVSDVLPLAVRYRDAAAYTLVRPSARPPEPSAWPWGPLTDPALFAPQAIAAKPLDKHLDGIGMIVARNGWGQDATYFTFKAGDNYWSHCHLDQGAFTLYKGGALAIDSGFYGPHYGSDEHLNYQYQSVAHNLVTVTDPADSAVMPGKTARRIANDGGQRRVGSGWGVSAPIDLGEWLSDYDTYHTGTLLRRYSGEDLVVAVADITPAYTNTRSGSGEFSARTRRVERMWRTIAYDRSNDVVVIHDQVIASRAKFKKRWLLHSQAAPRIDGRSFTLELPPNAQRQQAGGRLFGQFLLPADGQWSWVGGPGREFWVDGMDYNEDGKIHAQIARVDPLIEPGVGRLELAPGGARREDRFLVVLAPRLLQGDAGLPQIIPLGSAGADGVEVRGPRRTVRWHFAGDRPGVVVELPETGRRLDLRAAPPAAIPRSWWEDAAARLADRFGI